MKIKNNFQRHLILNILVIFNNLCLGVAFLILRHLYNVSFLHIVLVFLLIILYYKFFHMDYSKKLFEKYCSKECHNCAMWHCYFHYKDGKYIK